MKRREFISKTTAGYGAFLLLPGLWKVMINKPGKTAYDFKPYRKGKTLAPVVKSTPDDGFHINTFYDVTPLESQSTLHCPYGIVVSAKKTSLG